MTFFAWSFTGLSPPSSHDRGKCQTSFCTKPVPVYWRWPIKFMVKYMMNKVSINIMQLLQMDRATLCIWWNVYQLLHETQLSQTECALFVLQSRDAHHRPGVVRLYRQHLAMIDLPWRNFLSPEFGTKFQREIPSFWGLPNFLITQDWSKKASVPKISIIRLVVLVELWLVTDTDRQTRTRGHSTYRASIASHGKINNDM